MKSLIILLLSSSVVLALPYSKPISTTAKGFIRGDIILTPEQEEYYSGKGGRTGWIATNYRWPNNVVPYAFDGQNDAQRAIIRTAFDEMQQYLCITFVERTSEADFVQITISDSGCFSYVGRIGGAQQLNLDPDCYQKVVVQHEAIHALGFFHMHSAYDRDNYIEILWQNIIPGLEYAFDLVDPDRTTQFGLPYDYFSIMHYPYWAFSINDQPTMVSRDPNISLDYRYVMTGTDIQRIRNMYCP